MSTKIPEWLGVPIILLVLFLAAWLPRAIGLEELVTVDEPKWLTRSANFYQALTTGDFADTYQSEHPGVTIMWAGTLGLLQQLPAYAREAPGQLSWERPEFEQWLAARGDISPLSLLMAGRWWVVFATSLLIALGFLPLRLLLGRSLAVLVTLYVAWDPFYIGLSRLLHPDSLLASFTYLTLLLFLAWLYAGQRRRYLITSGLAMGLAWLTKTPAILLTIACGLLVLAELMRRDGGRKRIVLETVVWVVTALVTAAVLWPALLVTPVTLLQRITVAMLGYVVGHENPTFFLGEVNRSAGFGFYPFSLLLRWTPATLLGLGTALLLTLRFVWPFTHVRTRRTAAGLLLFAVVYLVGMAIGNKQFDRYALPAFLTLDVIAALGLVGLMQALVERMGRRAAFARFGQGTTLPSHAAMILTLVIIVLMHGLPGIRHAPYYLTYYNPLLGGSRTAQRTLMVGWGEGLKEAAEWINGQPNGDTARVASWYRDGSLSYFLESERPVLDFGQIEFWAAADYAVVYINQRQRRLPSDQILATLEAGEPVHRVIRNGIELVRVYARDTAPPDWAGISVGSATIFDDSLSLVAHSLGEGPYLVGESIGVRLYWELLDEAALDDVRVARLVNAEGIEVWQDQRRVDALFADDVPHEIVYDHLNIDLPELLMPGAYTLTVAIVPSGSIAHTATAEDHRITTVTVRDAIDEVVEANWDVVRLTGLSHESSLQLGGTFGIAFTAEGLLDGSLKASVRLIDPEGVTMAQVDVPVVAENQVLLDLPADANSGLYTLTMVIYDAQTLESLPDQAGNHGTIVLTIEVQ